ncbi:MAG TPA: hypothetical protein IAB59_01890 [Candidatus Onthousia faecipullorum]|uniref:Uncharacterized protein n=1 Tax=Candidatus Onthousia faecipullorum TaxID=2840887 RepID=A0A9D1G9X6_9FIRM|nr:hypothetical protein [Candidatus Onthousia faecipullorum]
MFIDKKIRSKQRELDNYLSTYANDFIHQEMKEDFDKVLDNIESLANTFNFKMGIEIAIFNAILLHDGYLSITCKYSYKKGIVDIKALPDDKTLSYVLKIFSGNGSCRHIAFFTKKVLDRFNIKNNIVSVDTREKDYNLNEIRLFLSNIHKKISTNTNHVINYISENDYNYFLDLTSSQLKIFGASNGFAYSLDVYNLILPLYSYDYSLFNEEFIDYRKVPKLTDGQAEYLIDKANDTIDICDANRDLLLQFYLQNFDNYQRINENYNKVYEKEKSLKLIKCAEHTKGDVDEL